MDPLLVTLIACLFTLFVSLVAAGGLVWENRASKNLALAASVLGGPTFLFITQLYSELKPTTTSEFILTEFGIDRAKPEIRQWVYGDGSTWRPTGEVYASNWLASHNPKSFSGDREKITHDLVLFSLANSLQTPDAQYWDVQKHSLVGKHTGGVIRFLPASPDRKCAVLTSDEMRSELSRAGNVFAGAPMFDQSVGLPPSSVLSITANSLSIRNHVCQIVFTIEPSGGVGYLSPVKGGEISKLPNGESRFETRTTGLDVKIQFFGIRAGETDVDKYRQWSSALVNGVRDWFEK
jgi:hypothetical protein